MEIRDEKFDTNLHTTRKAKLPIHQLPACQNQDSTMGHKEVDLRRHFVRRYLKWGKELGHRRYSSKPPKNTNDLS